MEKETDESEPERWNCVKDLTSLDLLALHMEEGATSQGMRVTFMAGKDTEADSLLEPPKGMQPY